MSVKFHHKKLTKEIMERRIRGFCSTFGWQYTVASIFEYRLSFDKMKTIEVGCGSGTFSLTLSLLGADVTLIDNDSEALEVAQQVFALYKQKATFIQTDIVQEPMPYHLRNKFDLVISGGLVEHFIGKERQRCIDYHYRLLKKGGFAYIGVPNTLSLPYQIVRLIRMLTGTWKIEIEKPFTYWELKKRAKKAGFSRYRAIGNYTLKKDAKDYSLGLISAILDLCPSGWRRPIKNMKRRRAYEIDQMESATSVLHKMAFHLSKHSGEALKKSSFSLHNYLSSGIILWGIV